MNAGTDGFTGFFIHQCTHCLPCFSCLFMKYLTAGQQQGLGTAGILRRVIQRFQALFNGLPEFSLTAVIRTSVDSRRQRQAVGRLTGFGGRVRLCRCNRTVFLYQPSGVRVFCAAVVTLRLRAMVRDFLNTDALCQRHKIIQPVNFALSNMTNEQKGVQDPANEK